jgi:protein SCO1/2
MDAVRLAAALAFAALVAACSPEGPEFRATDVTGATFGRELALSDAAGNPRTLADFKGKAVVVFFGFTQCPDICPSALSTLAQTMKLLGGDAERVQVLFVTIDPERDTPELLAQYVPAFDPRFLGLTGDPAAIEKAAKEFKVIYRKVPGKTADTYTMEHSSGTFVLDPQGRLRLYAAHGTGADAFAHDLRELLRTAS